MFGFPNWGLQQRGLCVDAPGNYATELAKYGGLRGETIGLAKATEHQHIIY